MSDTSRLIKLKDIVKNTLFLARKSKEEYFRFFQLATRAYRDLCLYHINNKKTVLLDMDSNNVIDFPSDYLSLIAIGIPLHGQLFVFTKDHELLIKATLDPVYGWTDAIDEKSTYGYGASGGKNDYYFNIDSENSRFVFNGTQRSEVVLQYVSSGVSATAETSVPVVVESAIQSYILYRDALYDPNIALNQRMILEADYNQEIRKLRALAMPSIQEIKDELARGYKQTPKR